MLRLALVAAAVIGVAVYISDREPTATYSPQAVAWCTNDARAGEGPGTFMFSVCLEIAERPIRAAADARQCASYGFTPGSDGFSGCLQRFNMQRRADASSLSHRVAEAARDGIASAKDALRDPDHSPVLQSVFTVFGFLAVAAGSIFAAVCLGAYLLCWYLGISQTVVDIRNWLATRAARRRHS